MWVKDIRTRKTVDHTPEYIEAFPGRFVEAQPPKSATKKTKESPNRAASPVSATAGTPTEGDA